jgi:UDP-glucose 4-epimerase
VLRILVTGGTGAIGPAVLAALAERGHWVRVLSRSPIGREVAPRSAQTVTGDITAPEEVARACRGVDIVVHLAALLHAAPGSLPPESYERINVGGTRHVVAAAMDAGVKRVVLASTIAVYGEAPLGTAREDTPPAPETDYARTKLEAERVVRTEFAGEGRSAVVLRLGAVYGSRMKGNYRSLVRALDRVGFVAPGPGSNRRSLIHDSDAARAILLAVEHPRAAGRVLNVADPTAYRLREIIDAISSALGRRPPRLHLPRPLALAAAGSIEVLSRMVRIPPPFTRSMVRKYNDEIVVDAGAIARDLGFAPRMTLESGWRQTIEAMRATGDLA